MIERAILAGWITGRSGANAAGVAIISVWPSSRALDQPENGDEDDRADDCGDDRSDQSANGYAKYAEQPAADQRTDNADDDVANQAKAASSS